MKKFVLLLLFVIGGSQFLNAQGFNGVDMGLGKLSQLSNAKTRSISPENLTGEKGNGAKADPLKDKGKRNIANAAVQAEELGIGWKVNPYVII